MIYKVLEEEEELDVFKQLENALPGTAKIFYVVQNVLNKNLSQFDFLVDTWPQWSCLVLRPKAEDKVPPYFKNTYICYAKDVNKLKYFLQRPSVVDWNKPAIFTGVPNSLVPTLTDMARKNKGHLSSKQSRFMYAWTSKSIPEPPVVPDGLQLSTLTEEDAEVLNEDWKETTDREGLDHYFQGVVNQFDNSCLRDETGKLLAYICMQYNGSMAMLFVRPEYRNNGFFELVLRDMTRKRLLKGDIAYGFIPTHDTSLINLCRKFGYEWVPQGDMTWVKYSPGPAPTNQKPSSDKVSQIFSSSSSSSSSVEQGSMIQPFIINAIPLSLNI